MSEAMFDPARPALSDAAPEGLGITLTVMPLRGMVTVRSDLSEGALAAAIETATGCTMPENRKAVMAGDNSVLWMSPDEVMVFCAYGKAGEIVSALNDAMGDGHMLAVDVSDARAIFRLEGENDRHVLGKGAPVDFAPGHFVAGDVRRTRIATVAAGIVMVSENIYEVFCFRSYAPYLWNWLVEASHPDGLNDL